MVLGSAGQAKAARSRWKPAAIWAAHRQVRSIRCDPFGHEWEIGKPIRPWPPDLTTAN
jgi:hypothetical protein